jgi:hypothetical protein
MKKKNWLIGISIIAISIFAYRTHTQREIERELARISNAKYAAEKAALEAYYKVSFDPRSCNNKNEQGNVFIAIGEQVFRVKWDESNKYLLGEHLNMKVIQYVRQSTKIKILFQSTLINQKGAMRTQFELHVLNF